MWIHGTYYDDVWQYFSSRIDTRERQLLPRSWHKAKTLGRHIVTILLYVSYFFRAITLQINMALFHMRGIDINRNQWLCWSEGYDNYIIHLVICVHAAQP